MSVPGAEAVGSSELYDRDGKPLAPLPADATPEQKDAHWFQHVYQGDRMPQLTVRAVVMGGLLGMLMAASNLYTTLAIGWAFGVAITACVMSFVIWNGVRLLSGHIVGRILALAMTGGLLALIWWKAYPALGTYSAEHIPAPWKDLAAPAAGAVLSIIAIALGLLIWVRQTKMSLLENNCMQSTASAAGYSTGSTIATMFGALLLLADKEGKVSSEIKSWDIQPIWVVTLFTLCTGLMGVFLAIPMKRQMINYEGLRFPSGVAAAETLRNLHAESKDAVLRAYVLLLGIAVGLVVGVLNTGTETLDALDKFNDKVQAKLGFPLRIPESVPENGFFAIAGKQLNNFQFDLSVLLIAAGVITRMRVCLSMFAGSLLLYCVVGPRLVEVDMMSPGSGWHRESEGAWVLATPAVQAKDAVPAQPATADHPAVDAQPAVAAKPATYRRDTSVVWVFDARTRDEHYLTNMPLNVKPPDLTAATVAKATADGHPEKYANPKDAPAGYVTAAFGGTTLKMSTWSLWGGTAVMVFASLTSLALQWKTVVRAFSSAGRSAGSGGSTAMSAIEVPTSWMILGMVPIGLAMLFVQIQGFHIAWWAGLIAISLSFFLVIVACRATGETDTTPIGAMGKVMQLLFAVLHPGDIKSNLASAGIAANSASSSADLLTDLKSGYLLGANPRKQFIAQFVGVFFGTLAVVPIWFLMVPNKAKLEAFAAPATRQWEAVARVLTKGIDQLPHSAQIAILIGAAVGVLLPCLEKLLPKHRQYLPSAMGLGLSWVIPFSSSIGFMAGAILGWLWEVAHRKSADKYSVGLASGLIAGEGLVKAIIAMTATAIGLMGGK